jgi:BirA family biotin operon repressor/biotin-[acetyl-CoA-carboxylase] ligase
MDFSGQAAFFPVIALETVGSTNSEALARADAGERGPLWVVARAQTAGRGRRGRHWTSAPGNLYASLLLTDAAPSSHAAGICFVAALALHDAVLDAAHGLAPARLRLKWPNDLLLDGRKLAGILVEGTSGEGCSKTVVGFGVNCRHSPQDTVYPATDLASDGFAVAPDALLNALGTRIFQRLSEWTRGQNFATTRSAWLARATGLGSELEVRLGDCTMLGTFETLDATGALVLARRDGARETIAAGDIFPMAARFG